MRKRMLLEMDYERFSNGTENWYLDVAGGADRIACQSFKEGDSRKVFIFLDGFRGHPAFRSLTQAAPVSERRICTRENS